MPQPARRDVRRRGRHLIAGASGNLYSLAKRIACSLGTLTASIALCVLATTSVWPQSPPIAFQPRAEEPEEFPAGAGREEAFYACTACHNFKLVAAQGLSRERWDETLTFMTTKHNMPEITGDDRRLILDYLTATYPPRASTRPGGWQNPFAPR